MKTTVTTYPFRIHTHEGKQSDPSRNLTFRQVALTSLVCLLALLPWWASAQKTGGTTKERYVINIPTTFPLGFPYDDHRGILGLRTQGHYWQIMAAKSKSLVFGFDNTYDTADHQGLAADEKMTLTKDGHLGIGTISPGARLEVRDGSILVKSKEYADIRIERYGESINGKIGMGVTTNTKEGFIQSAGELKFLTNDHSTAKMFINNDGQVGIGTTNPNSKLSLGKLLEPRLLGLWDNPDNWYGLGINSNKFRLQVGNSNASFGFYAGDSTEVFRIQGNGNVGIGTTNPSFAKLQIKGGGTHQLFAASRPDSDTPAIFIGNDGTDNAAIASNNADLTLGRDHKNTYTEYMRIQNGSGNVGIGTINPTVRLEVSGKIKAEGVILEIGTFPDYVFADEYDLMTLGELEGYVKTHKRLPKMPSETEVVTNGADLGHINTLLVEKVEELTLYTIDQDKQIKELTEALAHLKVKLTELLNR